MVWDSRALQTRQYARRQLGLPARIEVHAEHAEQLRLSYPDEYGRVTVVDVSEGGLGLRCPMFLPRQARLLIYIQLDDADRAVAAHETVVRAVVRLCTMTDVKPTYRVGMQFLDRDTPAIRDLLQRGTAADSPTQGHSPAGVTDDCEPAPDNAAPHGSAPSGQSPPPPGGEPDDG